MYWRCEERIEERKKTKRTRIGVGVSRNRHVRILALTYLGRYFTQDVRIEKI